MPCFPSSPCRLHSANPFPVSSERATHPVGDRGGLFVAQYGSFNWAKPGLHSIFNAPCTPCAVNGSWCYKNCLLGGARPHFETLHGIVPGLFIVRVAPFRQPLGTFHQQLCRHREIVTAKKNIEYTYYCVFRREHVHGSSEELCSLVPTRVQQ